MTKEINDIIENYRKFKKEYFEINPTLFQNLSTTGQKPKILVIACCDSRLTPSIIGKSEPGDLFIIRNIANLIPPNATANNYPSVCAALKFGVCELKVKHIIILGHTDCGGIATLFNDQKDHSDDDCINTWLKIAAKAKNEIETKYPNANKETKINKCGERSLINSLQNLRTYSWVKEKEDAGILSLHAWNFNVSNGTITQYSNKDKTFKEI